MSDVLIGFAGLGRMGSTIVSRLIAAGYDPHVWNRSSEPMKQAVARGAVAVSSPAALAERGGILFSMVTDDDAAFRVIDGELGFLTTAPSGTIIVELSTLRPDAVDKLRARSEDHGCRLIDMPVMGSTPHASRGQLVALAGGLTDEDSALIDILNSFCRLIVRAGPPGSGSRLKLVVNLMTAGYVALLSEALSLGAAHGLDLALMLDVIGQGPTSCQLLSGKRPILLGLERDVTFDLASLTKDLHAIQSAGASRDVPMPLAAAATALAAAATASGWGEEDLAKLPEFHRTRMVRQ